MIRGFLLWLTEWIQERLDPETAAARAEYASQIDSLRSQIDQLRIEREQLDKAHAEKSMMLDAALKAIGYNDELMRLRNEKPNDVTANQSDNAVITAALDLGAVRRGGEEAS